MVISITDSTLGNFIHSYTNTYRSKLHSLSLSLFLIPFWNVFSFFFLFFFNYYTMLEDNRNIRSVRYCTFLISCYIYIYMYVYLRVHIFVWSHESCISSALHYFVSLCVQEKEYIIVTVRILFDSRLTYFCEIF